MGDREPVSDLVHFNDYADRCILLCFGKGGVDRSRRLAGRGVSRLTSCSWDNLVRGATALSTLVLASDRTSCSSLLHESLHSSSKVKIRAGSRALCPEVSTLGASVVQLRKQQKK